MARSGCALKKRLFDLLLSFIGSFIFLPFMLVIAIMVRMKVGSPAFFRQVRPGLHGQPFVIYKFRTMTDKRDGNGKLLPDGDRLTRLGHFLRKLSIDELPELFNVLKGDMSLLSSRILLMQRVVGTP